MRRRVTLSQDTKMKSQIGILVVILAVSASEAFQCYDCTYTSLDTDKECTDSQIDRSSSTVNCTTYCKKDESYLLGTLVTITRSCSSSCTESKACEDNLDTGTCTYCCTSNECNASSYVTGSIFFTFISLCAAFMFQMK